MGVLLHVKQHLLGEEVVPSVDGAQVQVIVKARRPLAHMGALGQHQMVFGAVLACEQGLGVREAVVVVAPQHFCAQQLLDGGGQVHVVVEALVHKAPHAAGPLDDHGDVAGGLVGGAMLPIKAQLAHVLPVVRGDNHGQILIKAHLFHQVHNLGDVVIGPADAAVVAVHHGLHVFPGL